MDVKFYMTGTTRCRNLENAMDNISRYGKPAIVRQDGRFYDVTRLAERPVQHGQPEFKLRVGETIHNWEPRDG